jgi:hypothetical protein
MHICVDMLNTVDEQDSDTDKADRLRLFCKTLIEHGVDRFQKMIDLFISGTNCACSRQRIAPPTRGNYGYAFGPDRCSKMPGCGVVPFLSSNARQLDVLGQYLKTLLDERGRGSEETRELESAERFISAVLSDSSCAQSFDPCLAVADLLIAIESNGIRHLYSMNPKEFAHLCRAQGQTLVAAALNPDNEETVFDPGGSPSSI